MTMNENRSDKQEWLGQQSPLACDVAQPQMQALCEFWQQASQKKNKAHETQRHLPDFVLYDLAWGELAAEERRNALRHLADCHECIARLTAFQAAIVADREVYAIWKPALLYAAGDGESAPVIQEVTTEGKYVITLQPTDNSQHDLLTLAVTPSFRERLEGLSVIVVSSKGTVVLQGTISGGDITRLIPRQLRVEWPFRIQAI
jgi:hypothetical protein